MPRRRRTDLVQPRLHVFVRGSDRQDIFADDADRTVFETILGATVDDLGLVVDAYALMHNHVHLQVDRTDCDISEAMRQVLGRYARYFNDQTERSGPLFTGRFGCREIASPQQELQCSRYVHLNPLEFVPKAAITAYRWSSLSVYAGRRARPSWLRTDTLGRDYVSTASEYVDFVLRPQPGDDERGQPLRPWETVTLDRVDEVVRRHTAGDARTRGADHGGRADLRDVGAAAAARLRIASSADLADHYGYSSPSSARNAIARLRRRQAREPSLERMLERILADLRVIARSAGLDERFESRAA